jgi:hypothetical protein
VITATLEECTLIEDRRGNLWLGVNELQRNGYYAYKDLEMIQVNDDWYDVIGFSDKRRAFWVKPIQVEGAADALEQELNEPGVGNSQPGSG